MINTLTLFRRARLLVFVVAGLFMVVLPTGGMIIGLSQGGRAHDMVRFVNFDSGLSTLMCMIIVATMVTVDAKHGMVQYYAMTGEARLRHLVVRVGSALLIWAAIATAVSAVIFLLATQAAGSHAGLVSYYLHTLGGRLATSAVAAAAIGAVAVFTRNAGIAVGIGIIWQVVDNVLLNLPWHWLSGWHNISLIRAMDHYGHSSDSNQVVNGIVVALAWIAVLSTAAFFMEQRRDL